MKEQEDSSLDIAIEKLISIMPLLSKNLKGFIRTKSNLSPGSVFVCAALNHHGKLSMSGIGAHLAVPKPHVTSLVDKLIDDELAERLYDPNDRRVINIQLTEKGKAAFNAIKKEVHNEFKQKLEFLNKEQVENLAASAAVVQETLIQILRNQSATATDKCHDEL
ncbi:MAG TPA: MarR family transcriptional regulator [Bacteroidales bacterium]|nr:MarR family transcriptional regulator [Bacteroidales bacterium]HPT11174.1 MarR family transcriptional regulator [Bacteroidales bacterium]